MLTSAVSLLAAAPASAGESWLINLTGRGYGHGVGMSQYGAQGMAQHGADYQEILKHYYTGISFGSVADKDVRVLLTSNSSPVRITSASAYSAAVGSSTVQIGAGVSSSVVRSASGLKLTAGNESWASSKPIVFSPGSSMLRLANRTLMGFSTTANLLYHGTLTVANDSSFGLCTINTLPVESYVRGVVPRETPYSWHQQTLRAQAVAARTLAARHMGSGGRFDLYADTRSQSYGGASGETTATNAAVAATKGVIATYGGKPIITFYFSSSGGRTENCENVFTAKLPYLKAVDDPYDMLSPYHLWPENPIRWSGYQLAGRLRSAGLPSGSLQGLYVVRRGASPRVVRALAFSAGGATAIAGTSLRTALGLRSTWFDVRCMSIARAGRDASGSIVLRGRTYPALTAGSSVKISFSRGGVWRSAVVPAAAISQGKRTVRAGGTSYALTYSTWKYAVKPSAATSYRFTTGTSRSPALKLAAVASSAN